MPTYTIDEATGCWIWQGSLDRDGYGKMGKRRERAHRRFYIEHRGPIPDGLELDHICPHGPNRACVNPSHLEPVTHVENIRRGRGTVKLTVEKVAEIKASSETGVALARRYGVTQGMISHIRTGRWWRDVEPAA